MRISRTCISGGRRAVAHWLSSYAVYCQDGDFVVHSRHEAAENMHDGFRRLWISYRTSDADTGDTLLYSRLRGFTLVSSTCCLCTPCEHLKTLECEYHKKPSKTLRGSASCHSGKKCIFPLGQEWEKDIFNGNTACKWQSHFLFIWPSPGLCTHGGSSGRAFSPSLTSPGALKSSSRPYAMISAVAD